MSECASQVILVIAMNKLGVESNTAITPALCTTILWSTLIDDRLKLLV